jgi:hypothetical protein
MPAISSDNLIRIVAIVSIVAIVTRLWLKERRRSDDNSPMEVLLRMCLGDRRQVKRLIALERSRSPGISRREAIARAIESLRRDNAGHRVPPGVN